MFAHCVQKPGFCQRETLDSFFIADVLGRHLSRLGPGASKLFGGSPNPRTVACRVAVIAIPLSRKVYRVVGSALIAIVLSCP